MSERRMPGPLARRSFLSRMGAGAAAFGAAFGAGSWVHAQSAQNSAAAASPWKPVRHPEDDWFEQPAAKHRFFLDTTSPEAFTQALLFARNFYRGNANGYGLADAEIAQIICARHRSTVFAYNDAMWAKYGATLSERSNGFVDPKTKQAPTSNIHMRAGSGEAGDEPANSGAPLADLLKRGVRMAVCSLSTRGAATAIAKKSGASVDDVFKELTEHLVPNARMVPAGIVAVSRAQEHGYTFSYVT
jgi:intracellular sulfur oxidation DsrE/DsrF family protein